MRAPGKKNEWTDLKKTPYNKHGTAQSEQRWFFQVGKLSEGAAIEGAISNKNLHHLETRGGGTPQKKQTPNISKKTKQNIKIINVKTKPVKNGETNKNKIDTE